MSSISLLSSLSLSMFMVLVFVFVLSSSFSVRFVDSVPLSQLQRPFESMSSFSLSQSIVMSAEDTSNTIVVDLDGRLTRAGFTGTDSPPRTIPTIVARSADGVCYAGDDVSTKLRSGDVLLSSVRYPISLSGSDAGQISDFGDMECFLRSVFSLLGVTASSYSGLTVLLTEPALNSKSKREQLTQLMFDTFQVGAFYLAKSAVLALYGTARVTGVAVMVDEAQTAIVPVNNGYVIPDAVSTVPVGGRDVTDYATKLLNEKGAGLTSSPDDRAIVADIKQKLCYVSLDYDSDLSLSPQAVSALERTYVIPTTNTQITLGTERFRIPEVLFRPNIINLQEIGISTALLNSIIKCDATVQTEMYANVVLAGGESFYAMMDERLNKDLKQLAPGSIQARVVGNKGSETLVWEGGLILAGLPTFPQMCISKADYQTSGAPIVHTRCP